MDTLQSIRDVTSAKNVKIIKFDTIIFCNASTFKGPSTYYVILYTVSYVKRITFFPVNRVEHQKLNLEFLVFNSAFGRHRH